MRRFSVLRSYQALACFAVLCLRCVATTAASIQEPSTPITHLESKTRSTAQQRAHLHCLSLTAQQRWRDIDKEHQQKQEQKLQRSTGKSKKGKQKDSLGGDGHRNSRHARTKPDLMHLRHYWMERWLPTWTCPLEGE